MKAIKVSIVALLAFLALTGCESEEEKKRREFTEWMTKEPPAAKPAPLPRLSDAPAQKGVLFQDNKGAVGQKSQEK